MAMPLLVGPGVIAYIILHASEARHAGERLESLDIAIGIAMVSALCFVILAAGRSIQRVMGSIGLTIMTRVMGLLVAAIGVQFIVTGGTNILQTALVPLIDKLQ
jgi:small neutral amino acid transporter SnatA (MarC family)